MSEVTEETAEAVMCEAIPAASLRGFRADVGCASRANTKVEHNGVEHDVCRMHEAKWGRGDHDLIARVWGWG